VRPSKARFLHAAPLLRAEPRVVNSTLPSSWRHKLPPPPKPQPHHFYHRCDATTIKCSNGVMSCRSLSMWLSNKYTCPYCQGSMGQAVAPAPCEREYRRRCDDCRRALTPAEMRARRRWNDVLHRAARTPPEKRTKRQKTVLAEALAEGGSPDLLNRGEEQ
jgi:hypothetical protein